MKDQEARRFDLIIVSPDQVLYEGEATKLIVPGIEQELAILPDHTPLYAQLQAGAVTVNPVSGNPQTLTIEGGVLRVRANRVSLITGFDTRLKS